MFAAAQKFWVLGVKLVASKTGVRVSEPMTAVAESRKPLRMVSCPGCGAKIFIPGDLAPLSTTPCSKCGFNLMMPMQLRQFELRSAIASGGMGTVYRAFDTMLERECAVKLMKREMKEE